MTNSRNTARQGANNGGGYIRWIGYIYVAATVSAVLYELTRCKA
jgi:hypothetical protein